jgi:hypothetical protein
MRFLAFFAIALLLSCAFASNESGIRHYLDLQSGTACPGDLLMMNVTSSDGSIPSGIELRLVLYEPFYGLRGIAHTDANGSASIPLSRTGNYRIYFTTTGYIHADYVEFNYTEMCPPLPPEEFNLTVSADCARHLVLVNATSQEKPLESVFMRTDSWSSMSGANGKAFFPFSDVLEGYVFISAEKTGFASQSGWFWLGCAG